MDTRDTSRAVVTYTDPDSGITYRQESRFLDALRKAAVAWVKEHATAKWSRWIYYTIKHTPTHNDHGERMTRLDLEWSIIERTAIGKPNERWRRVDGGSHHGIQQGEPPTGNTGWTYEREHEFSGVLEYNQPLERGLDSIGAAIVAVFERLRDVLHPDQVKPGDASAFLIRAARGGTKLLGGK